MSIQEVVVTPREGLGKGEAKRLRKGGKIPSVVYGLGGESVSVSVEPKAIAKIIRSEKGLNSVLHLRLKDTEETRHVMIKDIDRHPVTDRLTHVDFLRINMDETVKAVIPIRFEGLPEGVKLGGILTTVRHEVEIECLPSNLIGTIVVDVTHLGMDDALRVKDLPKFDGVTYQLGPQRTIAVVHAEKSVVVDEDEDEDLVVNETPTA
jgi:large subunit ribosomal protein L25